MPHYIPSLFPNLFSLDQICRYTKCTIELWGKMWNFSLRSREFFSSHDLKSSMIRKNMNWISFKKYLQKTTIRKSLISKIPSKMETLFQVSNKMITLEQTKDEWPPPICILSIFNSTFVFHNLLLISSHT